MYIQHIYQEVKTGEKKQNKENMHGSIFWHNWASQCSLEAQLQSAKLNSIAQFNGKTQQYCTVEWQNSAILHSWMAKLNSIAQLNGKTQQYCSQGSEKVIAVLEAAWQSKT